MFFVADQPKEYEASLDAWVESISKKSGRTYYYHRKSRESKWELTEEEREKLLPVLDPYNNSLIIPLAAFVEFPMAEELVNNAMTYQVSISLWSRREEGWWLRCWVCQMLLTGKRRPRSAAVLSITNRYRKSFSKWPRHRWTECCTSH